MCSLRRFTIPLLRVREELCHSRFTSKTVNSVGGRFHNLPTSRLTNRLTPQSGLISAQSVVKVTPGHLFWKFICEFTPGRNLILVRNVASASITVKDIEHIWRFTTKSQKLQQNRSGDQNSCLWKIINNITWDSLRICKV